MINRKLNQIILALLVIGALVTFWTGQTVRSLRDQRTASEKSLEESDTAAETKVEPAAGPSANIKKHSSGKYEEFRKKFLETETTLERLESRRPGDERSVTRKNQAVSELRYWETQLNSLYSCIMTAVPREEAEALAKEQQEWRRQRDEKASAAAKGSAGNQEQSAEYTRLQAKATRERAYELLMRYKDDL
ncbi:MAG: DUF1311 domain-containing protein [Stomatobaculum sp.]|nr:DUF1311 domain-containing protein [Stomatobaculum sp.]